jgi:hypothetical protein
MRGQQGNHKARAVTARFRDIQTVRADRQRCIIEEAVVCARDLRYE